MRKKRRKLKILLFSLVLFVGCCMANAQTASNVENDTQFWNETQIVVWSNARHEISLNGGLRLGRDFAYATDRRVSFLYSYKPSVYLTLAGGYLYRGVFPSATRKTFENRFSASFTVNLPLKNKFKLADRNLFEYRAVNSRTDLRVYRNRLRVEREVSVGKTKIIPFGYAEVFYSQRDQWFRDRFAFGIGKKLSKKLSGEIYLLRQNDGVTRPGDLNVLGTSLTIKL